MQNPTEAAITPQRSTDKLNHIFGERIRSLLEDGYMLQFKMEATTILFAKLRHKSNGNRITLKAYPGSDYIIQTRNHLQQLIFINEQSKASTLHQP